MSSLMDLLGLSSKQLSQAITETDVKNIIDSNCGSVACVASQTNEIVLKGDHNTANVTSKTTCDAQVQCAIKTLVDTKAEIDAKQKQVSGALSVGSYQDEITKNVQNYNTIINNSCANVSSGDSQYNKATVEGSYNTLNLSFDQSVSAKSKCQLNTVDKLMTTTKIDQQQEQKGILDFLNNPLIWVAAAGAGVLFLIFELRGSSSSSGGGGYAPYPYPYAPPPYAAYPSYPPPSVVPVAAAAAVAPVAGPL